MLVFFAGKYYNKISNNYLTGKYEKKNKEYERQLILKSDSIFNLKHLLDSLHNELVFTKQSLSENEYLDMIISELEKQIMELNYPSNFYYKKDFLEWEERTLIILAKLNNKDQINYYELKMNPIKEKYWDQEEYLNEAINTIEKIILKMK